MDRDFVDALVDVLKHLEDRISFIRAREPRQHDQVNELFARLRAAAPRKTAEGETSNV